MGRHSVVVTRGRSALVPLESDGFLEGVGRSETNCDLVPRRHSPIRRGSTLALVAALGLAASSVGNLLEDAFSVDSGEWLFTYGGMTGAMAILALAVVVLRARHPFRWSGIFLVAFLAGSTFPDDGGQWLSGLSLLVMGWWLWQRQPSDD